ncbi:MAG: T9SS type A sorting domain-containing protein [Candidatus Eisenbacteria bacterium]|uniref:T9SS type A sorting domain-containing protein n=1 Tax=Eiseniibacteriota bacterium TaxID=2212470 RepID=A0A948W5Y9_UNCEI|nr:T9SS type A sorting domain-containing protein [Candidatus Eisenbacteria bacterium]MBU1950559.1 T9SS type A sorting domain-containing protein [Candidatus Eisenbacteria bacterium]MBU2690954.1 T9SS type A sorting domain-containing protein [Candidatus Eisenbacteria bacterium]
MIRKQTILFTVAILILGALPALAGWSSDPAVNLAIADGAGDQVVPKVAVTSDGGCYVSWYDAPAGYNVRLQKLDASGNEVWSHNGILVSAHPQNTWITDWDLIADSSGNAVIVFNDIRAGGDWDIYAYKVAPDGTMLWGADGIAISDNADFEASPKVTEASDGDFVIVWQRDPDAGDGQIYMQRLAPDGTLRLTAGGIPVAGETGKTPGFCVICPGDAGSVIVGWIQDMSTYYSNRYYRAEKFDASGASLWGAPVDVYNETALPLGYVPIIQSDGAGGAALLWHSYFNGYYNSHLQHLDAAGSEVFPHNGLTVSTMAGMYHIDPTLAQCGGDFLVFWSEEPTTQSMWGVYGQRFAPDGTRLWGNSGHVFLPMDGLEKNFHRALSMPDGAAVYWIEVPGGYGSDIIRGFRSDMDGNMVWAGSVIDVASTPSGKGRLPVALGPAGKSYLIWEDSRAGSIDVYGQTVNMDGSLGITSGVVEIPSTRLALGQNFPNPFNPRTTIRFQIEADSPVNLVIYDLAGRRVRAMYNGELLNAGEHLATWNGRDDAGDSVVGGVYFYALETVWGSQTRKMILLK